MVCAPACVLEGRGVHACLLPTPVAKSMKRVADGTSLPLHARLCLPLPPRQIWNTEIMAYVETLYGHQDVIHAIDSLDKERALSCGGRDRSLRLWKVVEESPHQ